MERSRRQRSDSVSQRSSHGGIRHTGACGIVRRGIGRLAIECWVIQSCHKLRGCVGCCESWVQWYPCGVSSYQCSLLKGIVDYPLSDFVRSSRIDRLGCWSSTVYTRLTIEWGRIPRYTGRQPRRYEWRRARCWGEVAFARVCGWEWTLAAGELAIEEGMKCRGWRV
jgi:hypothetical protein